MTSEIIRTQLQEQASRVKEAVQSFKRSVRVDMGGGQMLNILPDIWSEIPATNVHVIVCSLNTSAHDVTVVNARFEKDGHIQPHAHDRLEMVYVLEGTYRDPLRGVVLGPGGVDRIEPGVVHSSRSDDALVTVTWRPAYETEIVCDL